ncbi:MAG: hypothetical protein IJP89_04520 [Synergistaceae bacterium]|nr:hypothetical protein [Synergistaceae bacterium]
MRKRILCIALLSALIIGVFAGSALAATDYYQLTSLTISPKSQTAEAYASPYTLTGDIVLTAGTAWQNANAAPTGFNTDNKIKWTFTYSPTDMVDNSNKLTNISDTTIGKTATATATAKLAGKVVKPGTITVTATQGSNTKSVTFKVTIPEKPAPAFVGSVTLPKGTAGTQLKADSASGTGLVVTLKNFPENVTLDPPELTSSNGYYGVKAALGSFTASSATAATTRTVTFSGTPNFATDSNGLTITITASNAKKFGTGNQTTTGTYKLVVDGISPAEKDGGFKTKPAKTDLSEVLDATKKVIETGVALTDANQTSLKFEVTAGTLPVTITATGLPDGLVISQSAGLDASKNSSGKGTATAVIKGTPTKAGAYNKIVITAENTAGKATFNGSMLVLDRPEFTTTSIPTITWDKPYTTTLRASGAIDSYPVSFDVLPADKTKLPKGLSLDKNTGIFKGAFTSPDVSGGFAFGSSGDKTINITFRARNQLAITPKSFDIVVKAVKPVIEKQGALQNMLDKKKLSFDHTFTFLVSADGPGTIKWDVPTLPAGVTSSSSVPDAKKAVSVLKLTGKPTVAMKNFNVKLNPNNGAGTTSFALKFNVDYPSVDVKYNGTAVTTKGKFDSTKIPAQTKKTASSTASADKFTATSAVFTAEPGPISWMAKSLPSGIKLSVDKSVSYDRKAVLIGEFKSATKLDKDGKSVYQIIAKNTVTGKSVTISADLKVYAEPKITTNSLPKLTTGKVYNGKIIGTGSTASNDMEWTVTMTPGSTSALPAPKGKVTAYPTFQVSGGSYKLSVSMDKKTGMPLIVGSLDRIPDGDLVKVAVTLKTPYGTVSKNLSIDVTGVAPKFITSKLGDFNSGVTSSSKIAVTGTQPITLGAYIDPSTMAKYDSNYAKGGNNEGESVDLTSESFGGFSFTASTGTLTYTTGEETAFNGLPITFTASNGAVSKPMVKVIKVNVKGKGIQIVDDQTDAVASPDITIFVKAGGTVSETYSLSGDVNPFEVTVSPLGTTKNGITTAINADDGTVTIGGAPTAGKETKTPITITAKNKATNQKHVVKLTVIGQVAPEIKTKPQTKEVEVGRAISIKLQASGSKMAVSKATKEKASDGRYATKDVQYNPITWSLATGSTNDLEDLVAIGLSFDASSGAFKGTTKTTTSADEGKYTPYVFTLKATNDAGDSETVDVTIGVKGKKFKFTHKQIVINKGNSGNSYFLSSPDMMLKTDIASQDTSAYVKFAWVGNTYSTYGFEKEISRAGPSDAGNYGQLSGTFDSIQAVNSGVSLKISADNIGTLLNGTVKVVIQDAAPEIEGDSMKEIQAEKSITVSDTMDFTLKDDPTGDTRIKWNIGQRPTNPILNATLKPSSDGASALVTLKVQKTSSTEDMTSVFSVTAQNVATKAIVSFPVTVTIKGITDTEALPEEKDALPEDKTANEATETETESETEEAESEEETAEGTVSYGDARTEEWLTADERAAIAEAGYVIAAILPEVTADADGQYDLDAVTLAENAPEGESLVWFAFPRNAEKSDDDNIAEFYDEAGAEITAVPESRNVIASPWLREGVTYAPVIAVKAPVTSETKESLDEAEEGDTVTLEALEEATEDVSEDETPTEETPTEEAPIEK